jgi:DNA-binding CsgD family transcriptional regulator
MNIDASEKFENFLQAVLEGFVDGILVLSDQKEVIYANIAARNICNRLLENSANILPSKIWQVAQALIDSQELYPLYSVPIESEVRTEKTILRIRVQWLNLKSYEHPCLLIRLQDQKQFLQSLAIAEAQQWNLTPREAEVWLLRRTGHNRKEIANELYIALDTVKKHLKNIQTKRQAVEEDEKWSASQAS